jgi:hypothetical protein
VKIIAVAVLLAPALALAQLPEKKADKAPLPEKKAEKAEKKAASPSKPVATVNGVAIPQSRMEFMVQQQQQRGTPDNDQLRGMVRDELVNREILMQEAQRSGFARSAEIQTQLEMMRQEVVVGAYLRDWARKHPVSDADVQKEYERATSWSRPRTRPSS